MFYCYYNTINYYYTCDNVFCVDRCVKSSFEADRGDNHNIILYFLQIDMIRTTRNIENYYTLQYY